MIKEMEKGEKEKMLERNLYIHNIAPPVGGPIGKTRVKNDSFGSIGRWNVVGRGVASKCGI